MHQDILNEYRKDNPFYDVKLITKESLLSDYYGRLSDQAFAYILKNTDYSYDNIKSFIRLIPFVGPSFPELYSIKEQLIKNDMLVKNDYLPMLFNDKDIEIIGYSKNDKELATVLDNLNIEYSFKENKREFNKQNIYCYDTLLDEVFFVLNKIASLIKEGTDINDIYIYRRSNSYDYFLMKYAKTYGFSVDLEESYSLYTYKISEIFLNKYAETKDFDSSIEIINDIQNKDILDIFKETVTSCFDKELTFEKQLDYFIGELKSTSFLNNKYTNVVHVINKPIYKKGAHFFVLGLAQKSYPRNYKDDSFLSDKQREINHLNTSFDLAQIEEDTLLDFFASKNNFYYSFCSRFGSESYILSPFINQMSLNKAKEYLPDVLFSKDMAEYFLAKYTDLKTFYQEIHPDYYPLNKLVKIEYNNYDNQYSGVNALNNEVFLTHSYSSITEYFECPFKYYLDRVLKISLDEGTFNTRYGSFCHEVLQHQFDPDFDFDLAVNKYKQNYEFEEKEMPLLDNIIEQLREVNKANTLHYKHMASPKVYAEKSLSFYIDKNTRIIGKIDKTVVLKDQYIFVVDYKTGKDKFDSSLLEYGLSMQLPTYYLLVGSDKELQNYEVIGLFINNILDNSISKEKEDKEKLIPSYYKLNGPVVVDIDKIHYIDDTFITIPSCKSEFINGVALNKTGNEFNKSASLTSEQQFKDYADIVLNNYKKANKAIRNNEFPINPLKVGSSKDACEYCKHRDVCFVKSSQFKVENKKKNTSNEEVKNNG